MASAVALLAPGMGVVASAARPARAGAVAPPLRSRPARAHLVALAARTPPRSVSVVVTKSVGPACASAPNDDDAHGQALEALKSVAADAFRPQLNNLSHLCSLDNISDANDYNIGMPFGLVTAIIGCYQLLRVAPSVSLDILLGYMFYKLSVVSSQIHEQGFSNDFITRIKVAIAFIMLLKWFPSNPSWLGFIRIHVIFVYFSTFLYDISGWKQYGRYDVSKCVEILRAKLGVLSLAISALKARVRCFF